MRLLLSIILCLLSLNTWSIDLNFRFKTGYCQKKRAPGLNPEYFGECGNLARARIINKKYHSANLLGASLNSSYIYVSDFTQGNLSHLSIRRAVLMQSQFSDLEAKFLDLRGSHIKGVTFNKVNLTNLLATGARFVKTQFINCNLQNSEFWGGNLQEVDFSGSDLRGANLKNSFILFSNFKGAKFNRQTQLPFSEVEALKRGMIKVE